MTLCARLLGYDCLIDFSGEECVKLFASEYQAENKIALSTLLVWIKFMRVAKANCESQTRINEVSDLNNLKNVN